MHHLHGSCSGGTSTLGQRSECAAERQLAETPEPPPLPTPPPLSPRQPHRQRWGHLANLKLEAVGGGGNKRRGT
jgi:hypothetical protein